MIVWEDEEAAVDAGTMRSDCFAGGSRKKGMYHQSVFS